MAAKRLISDKTLFGRQEKGIFAGKTGVARKRRAGGRKKGMAWWRGVA